MSKSERYRQHAAQCIRASKLARAAGAKYLLTVMSQHWNDLAEQAEAGLLQDQRDRGGSRNVAQDRLKVTEHLVGRRWARLGLGQSATCGGNGLVVVRRPWGYLGLLDLIGQLIPTLRHVQQGGFLAWIGSLRGH